MEGLLLPGFWVPGLQMADLAAEERDGWDGREAERAGVLFLEWTVIPVHVCWLCA